MTAASATARTRCSTSSEECSVPPAPDALAAPPDDETLAAMAKAGAHPTSVDQG